MDIPLIELTTQHKTLRNEINTAIQGVLDSGDFILGRDVSKLEEEFASYCGTKYAIGVDSGLSALELSLRAFDIGPGDEVIVPAHTHIATPAAVSLTGATPVFVDVDPQTWNIDAEMIENTITSQTKAIIPVHLFGLPADMHMVLGIAEKYNLTVIEDACQAHGAIYKGYRVGNLGNAAAFSFYPTNNLGACGDAGMVTTNDARVVEKVRAFRNCGQRVKNLHEYAPFNHRLDTLQAAILRIKLEHLDEWTASRRRLSDLYNELLIDPHITRHVEPPGYKHVYYLYSIRAKNRDALQCHLQGCGIGTAVHYPKPVHLQPYYSQGKSRAGQFPIAEKLCNEILSLPMYPELTTAQVEVVADEIINFYRSTKED